MNPSEEQKGPGAPEPGGASASDSAAGSTGDVPPLDSAPHEPVVPLPPEPAAIPPVPPPSTEVATVPRKPSGGGKTPPPPPPPPPPGGGGDDEDDGMLRMSFLEHLEELRSRIIRALIGVGVAFAVSLI